MEKVCIASAPGRLGIVLRCTALHDVTIAAMPMKNRNDQLGASHLLNLYGVINGSIRHK